MIGVGLWIHNLETTPFLSRDTEKLERVQRQAARFITGDYHSREEGSVTRMLYMLELETLQRRRSMCRLFFLYLRLSRGWFQPLILNNI